MLSKNLTVIFGGGVGKNGSTVAVSYLRPPDAVWFSPFALLRSDTATHFQPTFHQLIVSPSFCLRRRLIVVLIVFLSALPI